MASKIINAQILSSVLQNLNNIYWFTISSINRVAKLNRKSIGITTNQLQEQSFINTRTTYITSLNN